MSDNNKQLMQTALQEIQRLRAELAAAKSTSTTTDIAIIGMGCQFPAGADNPEKFWQLLLAGTDGISDVPPDRWDKQAYYDANPDAPGKINTTKAGFLARDIGAFDAAFFNMTPKEAISLDPQQRLLLETVYQALENANIAADDWHKSATGVYVGMAAGDYAHQVLRSEPEYLNAYYETGNALSVAAGRIAYILGLNGPAMVVDTACSSSLVATHLAIQALRNHECEQAIVGGVNALLSPENSIAFSTAHMLAADGKCKAYAETADGYVRGEGCGVLLLKRLKDAEQAGDHILAVLKGSAVNQDGASGGLTVPNGRAQQQVIKAALRDAQLPPEAISYVETHGTGTRLGDPIEVNALQAVFGGTARREPLAIAAVKTNIGHLEAAAGVAGLIKTVLCLEQRYLPKHLHFTTPSTHINWENIAIHVNATGQAWGQAGEVLTAGVSSFGFSGTNAHLIVQQYQAEAPTFEQKSVYVLPLSAKTDAALQALIHKTQLYLQQPLNLAEFIHASACGRNHYTQRAAVVGASATELAEKLQQLTPSKPIASDAGVVFLFTGQGAQYSQMTAQLYQQEPVFKAALEQCHQLLAGQWDFSLVELLYQAEYAELLQETQYTQVALFVTEYALAQLWKSWGIVPAAVAGHSVGEYMAYYMAGILSLEDALQLLLVRGRLMQSLPKEGTMAAVFCSVTALESLLVDYPQVTIAAFNAPQLQVISGLTTQVADICTRLKQGGISSQPLTVSHAFHSELMTPILAEFHAAANQFTFNTPQLPLFSNVTGEVLERIDADYLTQQLRQPVQFQAQLESLIKQGYAVFLEVGTHQILSQFGRRLNPDKCWIGSLVKAQVDSVCMANALAQLYCAGINPNWSRFYASQHRATLTLPNYPFQQQRHWITTAAVNSTASSFQSAVAPMQDIAMVQQIDTYLAAVKACIKDITGVAVADLNETQSFLTMGLDSLLIVQLQQALERQFGVSIAINDFYQGLDSISKLADYLNQVMPAPDKVSVTEMHSPDIRTQSACVATATPDATALERIFALQMQQMSALMEQQLQLLQSGSQPTSSAPAVAPTQKVAPKASIAGLYKEIPTERNVLAADKQAYIDKLAQRFNARTQQSKAYAQQHKRALAHNRNVAFRPEWKEMVYQLVLQKAQGAKTYDIDGNEYIDITMGFGVNLFGHNPAFVKQALISELQQDGLAIGPISRLAGDVASLMQELTGLERTAFFNTGSEAVMVALRLARGVTGRDKIVIFSGSYHGSFDGVLATGWYNEQGASSFPLAPGTLQAFVDDVIVLQYGAPESLQIIEQLGETLAAVLVEPVQSRNPSLQPQEFVLQLRQITAQQGTALIFDEMITGFRLHQGGAQAFYGIKADLATYGKILGGGMPIGAVAGSVRFMDAIDGGYWQYGDDSLPGGKVVFVAGTFNLHPLAMAAAKAVLTEIKRQGPSLQEKLNHTTANFCEALNVWFKQKQVPINMVYCGSLFRLQMQGDIELLNTHLLDLGILIWDGRNCFFSTAHTAEDIVQLTAAIKQGVEIMYAEGWLSVADNTPAQNPVAKAAPPAIAPVATQADYPVSNAQRRLWALEQFDPELTAYNLPAAVIFEQAVDVAALHKAVQSLMMRHESLRTYFVEQEGIPRQKIARLAPDVLQEIELASAEDVQQFAEQDARTPFDLSQPPLIRITLIHLPDCAWLVLNLHHIIGDLVSIEILADDLFKLYQAYQQDEQANLPPLDIHYKEYSQWQEQLSLQEHQRYWCEKMAGATPLNLPLDHARGPMKTYAGAFYRFGLDSVQTEQFSQMCRAHGVTFYMGMTAVLNVLLARLSGQDDVVLGSIFLGREHHQLAQQIAFYVNTLPLRNQLNWQQSFAELLAQLKQCVLEASRYQAYPFDRLVDDLQLPRDMSRNPLFDVVLTMDDRSQIQKLAQQHAFQPVEIDPPGSLFDWLLYINLAHQKMEIALNYNTDLFELTSIQAYAAQLLAIMQQVSVEPNARLQDLN